MWKMNRKQILVRKSVGDFVQHFQHFLWQFITGFVPKMMALTGFNRKQSAWISGRSS
jgi:hypothetical protein